MPAECLRLWLSCWTSAPHIRSGVNQSWQRLAQELRSMPPERRHRFIRGPQGQSSRTCSGQDGAQSPRQSGRYHQTTLLPLMSTELGWSRVSAMLLTVSCSANWRQPQAVDAWLAFCWRLLLVRPGREPVGNRGLCRASP
eukprot:3106610-Pyramimonas_sp.AAC.1